jgi:hypothetical protein
MRVRSIRILRRVIYLVTLGIIGALMVLFFPAYTLLATFGVLALLALSRQLNFYKIAMMLKRYAVKGRKMWLESRMKLHTGFRDVHSAELENGNRRCR